MAIRSHQRLPSFVPEALGGAWFFVLLALAIALALAVFCVKKVARKRKTYTDCAAHAWLTR